jgi:hypothetical protein
MEILVQISYDGDGRGLQHRVSPARSPSRTPVWVGSFNRFRNAPSFHSGGTRQGPSQRWGQGAEQPAQKMLWAYSRKVSVLVGRISIVSYR